MPAAVQGHSSLSVLLSSQQGGPQVQCFSLQAAAL